MECVDSYAASPRSKPTGRTQNGARKVFVPYSMSMPESQGSSCVSNIHAQDRSADSTLN